MSNDQMDVNRGDYDVTSECWNGVGRCIPALAGLCSQLGQSCARRERGGRASGWWAGAQVPGGSRCGDGAGRASVHAGAGVGQLSEAGAAWGAAGRPRAGLGAASWAVGRRSGVSARRDGHRGRAEQGAGPGEDRRGRVVGAWAEIESSWSGDGGGEQRQRR
jgi:hypothetical protein